MWFQMFVGFSPLPGEMIQLEYFKWVETTNSFIGSKAFISWGSFRHELLKKRCGPKVETCFTPVDLPDLPKGVCFY